MHSLDQTTPIAAAFRGEPGEPSQDAAGGWSADDALEYREFALREEVRGFVALYGWIAFEQQIDAVRRGEDA